MNENEVEREVISLTDPQTIPEEGVVWGGWWTAWEAAHPVK